MPADKSARLKSCALIITSCLALGAAPGVHSQTLVTHRIPAALALEAVSVAVAACTEKGFGVTATVIDADAQRIAMLRSDTAGVHTFEASWAKAYTAVGFAPMAKVDSSAKVAALIAQFSARQPPGTLPFQAPEHMIFRAQGPDDQARRRSRWRHRCRRRADRRSRRSLRASGTRQDSGSHSVEVGDHLVLIDFPGRRGVV